MQKLIKVTRDIRITEVDWKKKINLWRIVVKYNEYKKMPKT